MSGDVIYSNLCLDKKSGDVIYSNASKQYLIMAPPAILTLHLKRFEQVFFNLLFSDIFFLSEASLN